MDHVAINNIALCHDFDLRDSQLRRFWSLRAMGITTDTVSHSINSMLSSFLDTICIENCRVVVLLPKKELVIPADKHTNAEDSSSP